MLEALWTLKIYSNLNLITSGVVIFETGRVFGGDTDFYYLGDYKVNGENIEGNVEITNYSGNINSVIGPGSKMKLKLAGKLNNTHMILEGYRSDAPQVKIAVHLTRRAELP